MLVKNILGLFVVLYITNQVSGACQINDKGISDFDKINIVTLHNDARERIARGQFPGQPRGINLKRMRWDPNLAIAAQRIANKCIFAHERVTDNRWRWVGQNLYTSFSSNAQRGFNWSAAVNSWLSESRKYRYPNGFSMATGHYTQVVWADTTHVGCGATSYRSNNRYQKLYVCNYGPGGNSGGPPYKTGRRGCENLC